MFFGIVLSKRYTNASADIIEVLAGLDHVDAVFTDLVSSLEHAIREGRDGEIRPESTDTEQC